MLTARALLAVARDDLHANFVRLAHYPHAAVMTRMADEMGLLVWSEIPVYWDVAFDNPQTLETALRMALNHCAVGTTFCFTSTPIFFHSPMAQVPM